MVDRECGRGHKSDAGKRGMPNSRCDLAVERDRQSALGDIVE
jgi:hypothetical protein